MQLNPLVMRPRACHCTFTGHAIYTNCRFPALKIFTRNIFLAVFLQGLVFKSFLHKTSQEKNCKVLKFILNAVNLIKFAADCFLAADTVVTIFSSTLTTALCLLYLMFPITFCGKRNNKQLRNPILDSFYGLYLYLCSEILERLQT